MFQAKIVEKFKTHSLCTIDIFSLKSYCLWDNVGKYCASRQATGDNIVRPTPFACWINKAAYTHSDYITLLLFHGKNGYANAPQCDVYTNYLFVCVCVLMCMDICLKEKIHLGILRFHYIYVILCGPGNWVGIATDYGLDGPGSNPDGDEIFRQSRPALGPT